MSARKSPLLLSLPGVVLREQRVFRCYYECNDPDCSPVGSEWVDEALVVATGYCPCCERAYEPYDFEEIIEERAEFNLGDGLDKALDEMERANADLEAFNKEAFK